MTWAIDIVPCGNLGNRMLQFLAAWKLQQALGDAEILTPNLPEWGLKAREGQDGRDLPTLVVRDNPPPFAALCELARSTTCRRIVIVNSMQRMECLPDPETAASLFVAKNDCYMPRGHELVINVRSAELLWGIQNYPLVPVEFYEQIISLTGLEPVFMGQIEHNIYCQQLKKRFPSARFLESQGTLQDFQTVRNASQIVISVSTFSWLAAWLSNAKQIFAPMFGFLNPMTYARTRDYDLLPADDARYRFFLFPMHFGLPVDQALRSHSSLTRFIKEMSPRQVNFLRKEAPLLKVQTPEIDFDQFWYVHTYMEAANEISEGWVAGPLEHYVEIGARRGYQPLPVGFSHSLSSVNNALSDLSLNRPATQSSLSRWSIGTTVEEDAGRAVSSAPQTPFAFHTDREDRPWWSVDLEDVCWVQQIVVVNRSEEEWVAERASPLVVSASFDRWNWSVLFQTPDGLVPGRDGRPLVWTAAKPVKARFIQIAVAQHNCLHLRQVRILGSRESSIRVNS